MAKEDEDLETVGQEPAEPAADPNTITVGDDADDDDDVVDSGAPAQAARPDGKPGRRMQFRAMRDQLRAAAETTQRLERDIAELRGRASAPAPIVIPQRPTAPDPVEAELANIKAQKQATLVALRAASQAGDDAKAEKLTDQWEALDAKRADIVADRATAKAEARRPRVDPQFQGEEAHLRATFPKIYTSSAMKAAAAAELAVLCEKRRQPESMELAQEAAAIVYARYGLGARKPSPSDADRAKHSATATRPGASAARVTFTPNKQQLKLAMAYTEHRPGLSDQQRIKAYYDEVLKPAGLHQ